MTENTPTAERASQIAVHVWGMEPIEPVRFIGEGALNVVFVVRVPEGEFAVRLCKEGSDATACDMERQFLRQAALCGVPAPSVHAVGVLDRQPYLIETIAPGISGDSPGIDPLFCWRRLGEYARRLHDIGDEPTRLLLSPAEQSAYVEAAPREWKRFLAYNLASLTPTDLLLALGVYTAAQRDAIADVFRALQAQPVRFGLNHNDLDPRHLFIAPDGTTTLIDWGCTEVNRVPHYDLMEIFRENKPDSANVRAFLDGYGMTEADFAEILPQVRDFQLLKSFDLVRWAIDRRPERIASLADRARKTLIEWNWQEAT